MNVLWRDEDDWGNQENWKSYLYTGGQKIKTSLYGTPRAQKQRELLKLIIRSAIYLAFKCNKTELIVTKQKKKKRI